LAIDFYQIDLFDHLVHWQVTQPCHQLVIDGLRTNISAAPKIAQPSLVGSGWWAARTGGSAVPEISVLTGISQAALALLWVIGRLH